MPKTKKPARVRPRTGSLMVEMDASLRATLETIRAELQVERGGESLGLAGTVRLLIREEGRRRGKSTTQE